MVVCVCLSLYRSALISVVVHVYIIASRRAGSAVDRQAHGGRLRPGPGGARHLSGVN